MAKSGVGQRNRRGQAAEASWMCSRVTRKGVDVSIEMGDGAMHRHCETVEAKGAGASNSLNEAS